MHVAPTSERAHKLLTLYTVSMGLANHHTLHDVGIDSTFSEMSLHNPPVVCNVPGGGHFV